ncbi:MAG: hypothetical protein J6V25_07950 [Oscillospiraceae bacterium]|nr:hypothetical protein [Oscillospiraceae bacterium]
MAKFSFNGMDEISASFEQLANITDEDKMSVIMPAARLLLQRQKEKILSLFTQRTGDLANSLTIEERSGDDGIFAYIFPKGKHRGSSTGKRKRKNGRSNGKYSGTNSEVAWILNFGSPRIAATHWLENANEEAEDEVIAAQQDAWNDLLAKKGL